MADGILNDNIEAWTAIGWLLSKGKGQLYMMVASPRMQREVVSHYTYAKAKFHDCADWKDGFQVKQFLDETKSEAEDIRAHFFVEFQDVLSGSEGKDWAANLGRLNHAREMLAQLEKNLVFCVTPDAQARIRQNARDFYDFTQRIFFEDQLPKEGGKNAPPRMPDKSVGVAVELDWTRPSDELLSQANELMEDGEALRKALRYRDALTLLNNARTIREAVLREEHPDTATTYNDIAEAYQELHKYPKALEYYGKAEVIWEKVYGTEHPNMAKLYNNLGTVYYYLMNFHTAEEYLLKALKIQECFLGANHPNTALTYYNLGNLYTTIGKHAKALLYHNKAKQNPTFQKRLNSYVKHRASPTRKKKKKK